MTVMMGSVGWRREVIGSTTVRTGSPGGKSSGTLSDSKREAFDAGLLAKNHSDWRMRINVKPRGTTAECFA